MDVSGRRGEEEGGGRRGGRRGRKEGEGGGRGRKAREEGEGEEDRRKSRGTGLGEGRRSVIRNRRGTQQREERVWGKGREESLRVSRGRREVVCH